MLQQGSSVCNDSTAVTTTVNISSLTVRPDPCKPLLCYTLTVMGDAQPRSSVQVPSCEKAHGFHHLDCALPCGSSDFSSVDAVLSQLQCSSGMDMVMLNAEDPVQSGSCIRNEVDGSDYIHEQRVVELFPPLPAMVMAQYYVDLPRCSPGCTGASTPATCVPTYHTYKCARTAAGSSPRLIKYSGCTCSNSSSTASGVVDAECCDPARCSEVNEASPEYMMCQQDHDGESSHLHHCGEIGGVSLSDLPHDVAFTSNWDNVNCSGMPVTTSPRLTCEPEANCRDGACDEKFCSEQCLQYQHCATAPNESCMSEGAQLCGERCSGCGPCELPFCEQNCTKFFYCMHSPDEHCSSEAAMSCGRRCSGCPPPSECDPDICASKCGHYGACATFHPDTNLGPYRAFCDKMSEFCSQKCSGCELDVVTAKVQDLVGSLPPTGGFEASPWVSSPDTFGSFGSQCCAMNSGYRFGCSGGPTRVYLSKGLGVGGVQRVFMSGPLAATFPCATASAGSSGWASVELNWGSCPAWLFAYAHNGSCGSWSAADGCSTYVAANAWGSLLLASSWSSCIQLVHCETGCHLAGLNRPEVCTDPSGLDDPTADRSRIRAGGMGLRTTALHDMWACRDSDACGIRCFRHNRAVSPGRWEYWGKLEQVKVYDPTI